MEDLRLVYLAPVRQDVAANPEALLELSANQSIL